jgi:hypothetical protein
LAYADGSLLIAIITDVTKSTIVKSFVVVVFNLNTNKK